MSQQNRLRVLLVDDQPDITVVLSRGLANYGIDVNAYNDPEQAISSYKAGFYDEIILDIRMPKLSGFQLARSIWKQDPEATICFLTAFEIYKREAEQLFPSLKSFCFIKKPILPSELASHIKSHLIENKQRNS